MAPTQQHHRVVVVGGGTAGITVAARLARTVDDVAVIDPADDHWYQPLWTLVGGGIVDLDETRRHEHAVMPAAASWIRDAAASIDPATNRVETAGGSSITYDALVVCPGIQLDFDATPGLVDAIATGAVSSNYRSDLAPRTWELIRSLRSGTAVFTVPAGPMKCAGAGQKIAYLACDHWRREGVLDAIDVHLVLPTPGPFGIPAFADALAEVIAGYGITLHTEADLTAVDPDGRRAVFSPVGERTAGFTLDYDLMHVVPHQSAPDWVKATPLADDSPHGFVDVDRHTLRHTRYPNVYALGDASSAPTAKTGAAVRKQAPVVAANLTAGLNGEEPPATYHGYSSCPIVTERGRVLLAEFDYDQQHTPSFPVVDLTRPRRDMWLLKRYGLPWLYWNLMLRGRA